VSGIMHRITHPGPVLRPVLLPPRQIDVARVATSVHRFNDEAPLTPPPIREALVSARRQWRAAAASSTLAEAGRRCAGGPSVVLSTSSWEAGGVVSVTVSAQLEAWRFDAPPALYE
jgi:hypothetical protein